MTFLAQDPVLATAATTSVRAIMLYGTTVAAVLLSVIWKPEVSLYVLTVLLPLQTTRYHLHAFPLGANIVDILLFSSIVGALLKRPEPLPRRPALMGFLLFIACFYYISLWRGTFFLSADLPLWIDNPRLVDYKNSMVMPLLTLATIMIVRTRRQIAIIIVLACVTVAAVDYSYVHTAVGRDFTHYSEEARDAGALGYAGENGLASYLVEITAFLLPFLALKRHLLVRAGLVALLCANTYCILFSYSREAYLALAAVLCFIAIVKIRWLAVILVVAAIAWPVLLPTAVQERMGMTYSHSDDGSAGQFDASSQERVMLWTDALSLVRSNPVFGTGFLTYAYMNRLGSYRDTHNFYLKMLVETGIAGLICFIVQLFLFGRAGMRLFKRAPDPFLSSAGLGFAALILAAAIVDVFGDRWLFIQVTSNLWILLGCVLCGLSMTQEASEQQTQAQDTPTDLVASAC